MRSLTSFPGQRTVGTNADWIQRNQIMWQRRAVARFDFTQHDVCVDVHRPYNRTSMHLFSAWNCTQYGPVVNTRHGGSRSNDDPSKSPIDRAEIASRLVTPLTVLNSLQKKNRGSSLPRIFEPQKNMEIEDYPPCIPVASRRTSCSRY